MSISHHIYQQWTNVISESDATVNLSQLAKLIDTYIDRVLSMIGVKYNDRNKDSMTDTK